MWAWAVLTGRSVTDLLTATICAAIVGLTGLVVGWTPPSNLEALLAGFAVALLFSYALSWLGVCVGLLARSAESAQAFGFMVLFPLTFISNALVPTVAMPELLRTFADWNPVSAVTSAVRSLWGDPNASLGSQSWSMQHPVIVALAWSIADPRHLRAAGHGALPPPHDGLTYAGHDARSWAGRMSHQCYIRPASMTRSRN